MIVLKTSLSGQKTPILLRSPLADGTTLAYLIRNYDGDTVAEGVIEYDDDAVWALSATGGRGTSDPRVLALTPAETEPTAIPAGWYFLISPEGYFEKVRVTAGTTTRATLSAPARRSYAAESELKPASVVLDWNVTWIGSEFKFWLNLSYMTQAGLVSSNEEGYTSDAPAQNPVTVEYVYSAYPQLEAMTQIAAGPDEFQSKLDHVWDNVVSRIMSTGLYPEQFLATAVLRQVVVYEFLLQLALGGIDPSGMKNPDVYADRIEKILESKWNELFITKQAVDVEKQAKEASVSGMRGRRIEW